MEPRLLPRRSEAGSGSNAEKPKNTFLKTRVFAMETFNPTADPMEHRAAPRSPSSMRAYLITASGAPLPGIATNFSRSGLFLQTPPIPATRVGDTATIVFALKAGNIIRVLRYPVIVRRQSPLGYGLQFGRSLWSTAIFRQPRSR
jgi:hypothetical protein